MALKFSKLTRPLIRKLASGKSITEHGITFERQINGDGRYSINIMVDGQRIHRVVGRESEGVTRQQAEDCIQQLKSEARHGRLNLPKGRKYAMGFREGAIQYLSRLKIEGGKDLAKKQQRLDQHLVPFFQDKPLVKISTSEVNRYKLVRQKSGAANGTINRELAVLSHLFTKMTEWSLINQRPAKISRLPENKGRIPYLTNEQIQRLIDSASHDQSSVIYPFIVIGLETSMRRSEILSIRLENIDLVRRTIYIPKAKSGAREQPITNHLAKFLEGYLEVAGENEEWLFPSSRSITGHTMNIEKPWKRVVLAAGLDPAQVVRHTLRHTAITHLVQAGVDLPTVKRISGHKTLMMVERYSHQNGEHIRSAMDKLDQRYRTGES